MVDTGTIDWSPKSSISAASASAIAPCVMMPTTGVRFWRCRHDHRHRGVRRNHAAKQIDQRRADRGRLWHHELAGGRPLFVRSLLVANGGRRPGMVSRRTDQRRAGGGDGAAPRTGTKVAYRSPFLSPRTSLPLIRRTPPCVGHDDSGRQWRSPTTTIDGLNQEVPHA